MLVLNPLRSTKAVPDVRMNPRRRYGPQIRFENSGA